MEGPDDVTHRPRAGSHCRGRPDHAGRPHRAGRHVGLCHRIGIRRRRRTPAYQHLPADHHHQRSHHAANRRPRSAARAQGRGRRPHIILTAQGTVETAVEAIKEGAYDYLTKPIEPQRLRILLEKVVERQDTIREVKVLRRQPRDHGSFGPMIGSSAQMRAVYHVVEQAAPTAASVLVWGGIGDGQGTGGADDSPAVPTRTAGLCPDQLRRHLRGPPRERDLRSRGRGVHRRVRAARGLL